MSFNTFGKLFRFTTWGESHGQAIGCVVDGCPPNIPIKHSDIQKELNKRKQGQSKFTTQRKEDDKINILSGVFEGRTTGTPISLIIYNKDMRSRDYETIKNKFRPGHADYTYFKKYGIRDYRGGGRQSARETAARVAAGAIAKVVLKSKIGKRYEAVGAVTQLGILGCDLKKWKDKTISSNPFLFTVPTANAFGSLISVFFALLNHSSKSFIGLLCSLKQRFSPSEFFSFINLKK